MFWRFGFHNPSAIDTLLEREDVSLEEVMEEEDFLQEAKTHNQKLVEFLSLPDNLSKILYYITATDLEESKRLKYPLLCCEVIACEIPQIMQTIVIDQPELLRSFWTFLDRRPASESADTEQEPSVDFVQASYFCKAMTVLLTKQPVEVLDFIKSDPDNLTKIFSHLKTSAIMDLLLTLVRMEELPEGRGIVQWLSDLGLLEHLVDHLDPHLDTEEHSIAQQCICEIIHMSQTSLLETPSIGPNDLINRLKSESVMQKLTGFMLDPEAPNATSSLINGVTIIIDLIRHNNSDVDADAMMGYPNNMSPREIVSLDEMLRVLANHISMFNDLLLHPRSVSGPVRTSIGEQSPLGFERLKICELFAELLHCSNMSNLNYINDETTDEKQQPFASANLPADTDNGADESKPKEADESSLSEGDYLKLQLVRHRVLPTCTDLFFSFPWNNFLHYVIYDMLHQIFNGRMDKGYNRHLAISVLKDGQLTAKIVQAQKKNDEACAKPKGMRLGFMGHLTFIADEICKLFEGYPGYIVDAIKDGVDMQEWADYCETELKETKDRDRLPLGGSRPNDEFGATASEDEEEEEDALEGGVASQYSRYLAQRASDHRSDEEDDDDNDHWITGHGDIGREYVTSLGGGVDRTNVLDDDEHYVNSDDEEDSEQVITHDWTRGFAQFPPTNVLHRTQSRMCDDEDDEGDDYDHLADAEELERRASLRGAGARQDDHAEEDEDEDPFGEFTGGDNTLPQWTVFNKFEGMAVNDKDKLEQDQFVRAVVTREEQKVKEMKEYQPRQEDEQEGEI